MTATRRLLAVLMFVTLVCGMNAAGGQIAVTRADGDVCPAQIAALEANHAKIDAHNAQMPPGGAGPPSVVEPFNRAADDLNAEKDRLLGNLKACAAATDRARAGGPAPKPLGPNTRQALQDATALARPRWTSPGPPVKLSDGRMTIPQGHPLRPLWDVIKRQETPMRPYPNVPLQGDPRPNVGFKHPSGYTVGRKMNSDEPAVSPDHIVPKVEIPYLPRFLDLTPENMWEVLNAPMNLQWLPTEVNEQNKNSRSAADMVGVDPAWKQQQIQLQDQKRSELTQLIAQLADSQVPTS